MFFLRLAETGVRPLRLWSAAGADRRIAVLRRTGFAGWPEPTVDRARGVGRPCPDDAGRGRRPDQNQGHSRADDPGATLSGAEYLPLCGNILTTWNTVRVGWSTTIISGDNRLRSLLIVAGHTRERGNLHALKHQALPAEFVGERIWFRQLSEVVVQGSGLLRRVNQPTDSVPSRLIGGSLGVEQYQGQIVATI